MYLPVIGLKIVSLPVRLFSSEFEELEKLVFDFLLLDSGE
jgi:hypothetical protein